MSSIVTENGILHYESIGKGRPLILLHGWINSWDVWRDSMITLASKRRNRVYALDFWGFGSSAKSTENVSFRMDSYVNMVREFMDTLGIQQSPVFGHSMGGTVALKMALANPERVTKIAVVGSPIIGKSLNPFLKLAGYTFIAELVWRYPRLLQPITDTIVMAIMRLLLAGDSKKVRDMITRDVQRTTIDSFVRSIGDLRQTDLSSSISSLDMPMLGIYGVNDNIVSPRNAQLLTSLCANAEVKMMEKSRHFPMTDEPDRFINTLNHFLTNGDGPK